MAKKFVILFFVSFSIVYVSDTIIYIFEYGVNQSAIYYLTSKFIANIVWSIILCLGLHIFDMFMKRNDRSKDCSMVQKAEYNTIGSVENVYEKANAVLKSMAIIKHIALNKEGNRITAITKMSWKGIGEKIELYFSQKDNEVKIVIISKPRSQAVLYDYGKNLYNVEMIISKFKEF